MKPERPDNGINDALIALQWAATPEEVWKACDTVIRTIGPVHHTLLGLPSLGIKPIFLRTTLDLPSPLEYFARLAEVAPLHAIIMSHPGITVCRMSDHCNPTPEFRAEFMAPIGWEYSTAMLFWDVDGTFLGQLSSIRSESHGDYTDEELEQWKQLYPHVNGAVRRLFVMERATSAQLSLEQLLAPLPLPMVTVAWDLKLTFANNAARDAMNTWRHGTAVGRALKPSRALPGDLRIACLKLKEAWNEAFRKEDFSSLTRGIALEHPTNPGFRAVIQIVETGSGRTLQPSFTILLHLPASRSHEAGQALGNLSRLTRTEQEVARLAASGCNNIEIAKQLGTSLNTIRAHLRNVFEKLGISSRGHLAPLHSALDSFTS